MRTQFRSIVAVLLAISIMTGCANSVDLSDAQLHISLITPLQRNIVKDQELRVLVDVLDASGKPISGVKVVAEVLDAFDTSLGEFACKAMPDKAGQFQSDVFVPADDAKPGAWEVKATASHGESATSGVVTVQVNDTLGGQTRARHGFYLNIPPNWQVADQQSSAERGYLLLDPLLEGGEKALLEIHYIKGEVDVDEEAVSDFLLSYQPKGYDEGNGYVRQVVPISVQGHEGFLARGGLVASGGNSDYNFGIQVFRFHCDETDRTFTAIVASTSDSMASQMAAMLDGLACH